jgi:hypothetical protein
MGLHLSYEDYPWAAHDASGAGGGASVFCGFGRHDGLDGSPSGFVQGLPLVQGYRVDSPLGAKWAAQGHPGTAPGDEADGMLDEEGGSKRSRPV